MNAINDWTSIKMHENFVAFFFVVSIGKIYVDFKIYCPSIPFCIRHHQFSFHFDFFGNAWKTTGPGPVCGCAMLSWKLKPFIINYLISVRKQLKEEKYAKQNDIKVKS